MTPLTLKLIAVGDSNVGKTSIIQRYCDRKFTDTICTVGVDNRYTTILYKEKTIKLCIWDPPGGKKMFDLVSCYLRNVRGAFFVFDVTNEKSLINLNDWLHDIDKRVDSKLVKIIVGNKCDLKSDGMDFSEYGQTVANYFKVPYFEVSSKNNINVDDVMYSMVEKIFDSYDDINELELEETSSNNIEIVLPTNDRPEETDNNCFCSW